MRRTGVRVWFGATLCLAGLGAAAWAQQGADEVTPRVQQLYAEAHAAQASGDTATAISKYRAMLQLAPHLAPAYNNLGMLYFNGQNYREAAATLSRGLALDPGMSGAQAMLGMSYLEMGEAAKAEAPLEAAVRSGAADSQVEMSLARAQIAAGNTDKAEATLDAYTREHPKDQEAWYLLGKLHLQLSQQALVKVQQIDPNAPLAHQMQGEIMESLSNTPGAVAEYKAALALAPDDVQAEQHLADLYWKTGDWAHARAQLTDLVQKQPGNCYAHWKLGNTLAELDEPPEAGLKEENTALEQCPQIAQARAERARLLLRQGKAAAAIPDLKTAEQAAPDEPSVQRLLAEAYRATGNRAAADAANKRFVALQQAMHQAEEKKLERVSAANQ